MPAPKSFGEAWEADDGPAPTLPPDLTPSPDAPAVGDRIRLTHVAGGESALYPGATGTVTEAYGQAFAVDWDDALVGSTAVLVGVDRWEVVPGG